MRGLLLTAIAAKAFQTKKSIYKHQILSALIHEHQYHIRILNMWYLNIRNAINVAY